MIARVNLSLAHLEEERLAIFRDHGHVVLALHDRIGSFFGSRSSSSGSIAGKLGELHGSRSPARFDLAERGHARRIEALEHAGSALVAAAHARPSSLAQSLCGDQVRYFRTQTLRVRRGRKASGDGAWEYRIEPRARAGERGH